MSSSLVSEALMEATWIRVAQSTPSEALHLRDACEREQEELMGFVVGFVSKLRREVAELVMYLHVVISEAFRRSGAKFKPAKPGRIMRRWESAEATVDHLKEQGQSAVLEHMSLASEPAVFRYIFEALTEDTPEDRVTLTDDEFWHVAAMLMTVSDCLHDARKGR